MGFFNEKMINRSIRWILSVVLAICLVIPTTTVDTDSLAKTALKLNYKTKKLVVKQSFTLKMSGLSQGQKTKWVLAKDGVVKKVSATKNTIKLKAVKPGKTKVKAKVGSKAFACTITVHAANHHTYKSFTKFAGALSDLIKENPVQSSSAIAANDSYYTGRLIVKMKSGDPDFSGYDPSAVLESDDGITILQFKTSEASKKAFQDISNRSDVEWVESDQYAGKSETDDDTMARDARNALSWGVSRLGCDTYARKTSSTQITVAVVDTGVSSHSFLSGRIVSGYDYVDNDSDPSDLNSHGTHVSGTIVDCTPGLNVKIMPVRVLDASGSGYMTTIATGIRYAVDHGAKVINMSLGGGHSSYVDTYVQYAVDHGVTVVVAAGNNSGNTSSFCPAHITNAIVVAALDDSETRAYFSNYGNSVDVAAPGVDIVSCIPGGSYASYDGTSMATPHVAAIAAMVMINNPGITPAAVEQKIKNCARDLGTSGWDMYYGYGIPDLSRMDDSTPVPTATPTIKPTAKPTATPITTATPRPTVTPGYPTTSPTVVPTRTPAVVPTRTPVTPTIAPTKTPTPYVPDPNPSGDYIYSVQSDGTAVITGYRGSGGSISIPTTLDGYTVSGINDGAFRSNSNIRYMSFSGILWIGSHAFDGCTALQSMDIYSIINGIGSQAFANCGKLSIINIWGMTNRVSTDIFSGCTSLTYASVYGIVDRSMITALNNCPGRPNVNMNGMVN